MHGSTRLPQVCGKFSMLSSVCHNGRGRSGILAGRSWAFKPPDVRVRSFEVLRLLVHSKTCGSGSFPPAMLECHHAFRNICLSGLQAAQTPNCRRLSLTGSSAVRAESPERLSEDIPKEDLASFRPPAPAPPITPQDLLEDVPFHYWYSYADLPDNSSRKKNSRRKKSAEQKSSFTTESLENSASDCLQRGETIVFPVTSVAHAGEPRRSLMREPKDISDSCVPQAEEPRKSLEQPRSLLMESRVTSGSSINSGSRRDLRDPSGLSSPHARKGIAAIDSMEECSERVDMQDTTGIVEEDKVGRFELAENLGDRSNSVRNSNGKIDEEHKSTISVVFREGTGTEKEAFLLSKKEIDLLVATCNRTNRQINMGWRGWGHNYISLVHSYWKKSEVCKIKCKGAVTLDMDFLCNKLEEKTGGRVIHRNLGVVYLYRGRAYDSKFAPKLPVMHQRKKTPAKRLPIPFGLTKDDVNAMRARGKELPALCKLAKNGVYVTLLDDIRKAFETSDLVRVNCQGFEARNFRALGVKLKKLVPCVLISYEFEHILMWRWDGYKVPSPEEASVLAEESFKDDEEDVEP